MRPLYAIAMNSIRIISLLCLPFFFGCTGVNQRFEEKAAVVESDWLNTMELNNQIEFTWSEALAYLYDHNNELVDARQDILFAEEEKRVAWKRLIPRPSVNLTYTKLINDIDDTDWDDITSVLDLFVSFPNPFTFAESLYRSEYIYQQAVFDSEMKRRTLTAQLLVLYHTKQVLEYQEAELEAMKELSLSVQDLEERYESARIAYLVSLSDYHESMRDLLGNEYVRFDFKKSPDAPFLDYSQEDLHDPRLGLMYRRMAALEMVAMDLNVVGIQISRLPQFGFYTLSPPLYQRHDGNDSDINFDDVRVSASVYYSYDTSGATQLSIDRAKYLREVQEDRISEEMTNMFERFTTRQEEIKSQIKVLDELDQVIVALKHSQTDKANTLKFKLEKQRAEVVLNLVSLQSKIWVMDEAAWESGSQLALLEK